MVLSVTSSLIHFSNFYFLGLAQTEDETTKGPVDADKGHLLLNSTLAGSPGLVLCSNDFSAVLFGTLLF